MTDETRSSRLGHKVRTSVIHLSKVVQRSSMHRSDPSKPWHSKAHSCTITVRSSWPWTWLSSAGFFYCQAIKDGLSCNLNRRLSISFLWKLLAWVSSSSSPRCVQTTSVQFAWCKERDCIWLDSRAITANSDYRDVTMNVVGFYYAIYGTTLLLYELAQSLTWALVECFLFFFSFNVDLSGLRVKTVKDMRVWEFLVWLLFKRSKPRGSAFTFTVISALRCAFSRKVQ